MSSSTASQVARAVRDASTALENADEVYAGLEGASDLPQAFQEVSKALPAVRQALKAIKSHLSRRKPVPEKEVDKNAEKKEKDAADKIHSRSVRLYDIFDAVIPTGDGPRTARYRSAAGKGGRVEVLMKEILEAVIVIAKPPIVGEDQVAALRDSLQEVAKIPPSLEEDPAHSFHNHGSGPQSIHLGQGDQNINTGSGMQFNGKFMAPFHLPKQ